MAIISSSDLANWLGIDDSEDNIVLGLAAAAACEETQEFTGRSFEKVATDAVTARKFWPSPCGTYCIVDDIWSTTNLVVAVDTGDDGTFDQTWTIDTDFYLEPVNGLVSGRYSPYTRITATLARTFPTWPTRRPPVRVTAAWGWATNPTRAQTAALIRGAAIYHRKNSPSGVIGGFTDFTPLRVAARDDPDFVREMTPFVRGEKVRFR